MRSATISLHTGTNVPRRASSLKLSNDVMFIWHKLRQLVRSRRALRVARMHADVRTARCERDRNAARRPTRAQQRGARSGQRQPIAERFQKSGRVGVVAEPLAAVDANGVDGANPRRLLGYLID